MSKQDDAAVRYKRMQELAIGSILVDGSQYKSVFDIVGPQHFADPFVQSMAGAMISLNTRGQPVEPSSVAEEMQESKTWTGTDPIGAIIDMISLIPVGTSAPYYAEQVKKHHKKTAGGNLIKDLHARWNNDEDIDDIIVGAKLGFDALDNSLRDDERMRFVTCAELIDSDFGHEYLIAGILAEGQPTIVGGKYKTLKTSLLVEMALAMGTGCKFLGEFSARRRTVALLSGESGGATIQAIVNRVANERDVDPRSPDVNFCFDLPAIASDSDLALLDDRIESCGAEVVMIDPAYLCLTSGAPGLQESNVFQMGPLLGRLTTFGQRSGVTVILCTHCRKNGPTDRKEGKPAELSDLAMSGFAEWARQWLLLTRREVYVPGTGSHRLWLSVGGSAGHDGLWGVDVEEGRMVDDDPNSRRWRVSVREAAEVRQQMRESKTEERERVAEESRRDTERKRADQLYAAMKDFPKGETVTALRSRAKLSGGTIGIAVEMLVDEGRTEKIQITKGNRSHVAYKPVNPLTRTAGQTRTDSDNGTVCPSGAAGQDNPL